MTRRSWLASAGVLLALTACTGTPPPDGSTVRVSVVGFTETSHEPGGAAFEQQVLIHLAHHDGTLDGMRFDTRIAGTLVEERRWSAATPDVITVRNWSDCRQSDEPMPPPRPRSVEQVLTEYFGPRRPPATAHGAGPTRWTERVDEGMIRTFTDDGTGYPDGRTASIGADGDLGTTLSRASVVEATTMPDWETGWDACRPTIPQ